MLIVHYAPRRWIRETALHHRVHREKRELPRDSRRFGRHRHRQFFRRSLLRTSSTSTPAHPAPLDLDELPPVPVVRAPITRLDPREKLPLIVHPHPVVALGANAESTGPLPLRVGAWLDHARPCLSVTTAHRRHSAATPFRPTQTRPPTPQFPLIVHPQPAAALEVNAESAGPSASPCRGVA